MPATRYGSGSHTTLGSEKALRVGYRGLRGEVDGRLARGDLDEECRDILCAIRTCLDAAGIWHGRYAALLGERIANSDRAENAQYTAAFQPLRRVPELPPRTLRDDR